VGPASARWTKRDPTSLLGRTNTMGAKCSKSQVAWAVQFRLVALLGWRSTMGR